MRRLPASVADAWEWIAAAWSWPPSEMDRMTLEELLDWRARAEAQLKARAPR